MAVRSDALPGPEQVPAGAVLVGSGASGYQIADELVHAGRQVYLSVSRHRRAPRRLLGKDLYWWLEQLGRFPQTTDSLPDRRWPPSTVVTGVSGGYDVDVRQLAADGAAVVGRVVGVSGTTVAIEAQANRILDEADQAFADFLAKARELVGDEVAGCRGHAGHVRPSHSRPGRSPAGRKNQVRPVAYATAPSSLSRSLAEFDLAGEVNGGVRSGAS
jgi:putative flavoprotein involved in K+ transport